MDTSEIGYPDGLEFRWEMNDDTWHEYFPEVQAVAFQNYEWFYRFISNLEHGSQLCQSLKSLSVQSMPLDRGERGIEVLKIACLSKLEELTLVTSAFRGFRDADRFLGDIGRVLETLPHFRLLTMEFGVCGVFRGTEDRLTHSNVRFRKSALAMLGMSRSVAKWMWTVSILIDDLRADPIDHFMYE